MGRPRSVSLRNTGPDDGLRIVVGAIQTGRQRAGAPADGPSGHLHVGYLLIPGLTKQILLKPT